MVFLKLITKDWKNNVTRGDMGEQGGGWEEAGRRACRGGGIPIVGLAYS